MSVGQIAVAAVAPCGAPGVAHNQDALTISRAVVVTYHEHGVSFETSLIRFRHRDMPAWVREKIACQPESQRYRPALTQAAFDFRDRRIDRLQVRVPAD